MSTTRQHAGAVSKPRAQNWPWLLGLAALGLISRFPFASRILYHWDSINYTLALREYNIQLHQPHPPGYLLYVLLTRAVHALVGDPNWTFVGLNIVASIVACGCLYELGVRMFERRAGAAASLLLMFSPLFWFYGEIALPHILDGLMVTVTALVLYRVWRGEDHLIIAAAVLLGVAGGIRQQTLVFLAPLAVFAFIRKPFWKMALGAGVTALVFAASFVPMVMLSGGLAAYQEAMAGLTAEFFPHTSVLHGAGLAGVIYNLRKLVPYTGYALAFSLIPLAAWLMMRRRDWKTALRDGRTWFVVFWIAPALLFYTFIHMGMHGLILAYLPALALLAGKACADLGRLWRGRAFNGLLLAVLVGNILLFAALPAYPFGEAGFKLVNRAAIVANDEFYETRFAAILAQFAPAETVILASQWRYLQYYLPQYRVISASCESAHDLTPLAEQGAYKLVDDAGLQAALDDAQHVVLFDLDPACLLPEVSAQRMHWVNAAGGPFAWLDLEAGEALRYTSGIYSIRP